MKHAIKSVSNGQYQPSARVVDGKLILSFPHAINPVVWQMDLTQAKASALEVLEGKNKETYALILKTARGEASDVAAFAKREEAVDALMAAARALENAHGQIRPSGDGLTAAEVAPLRARAPQIASSGKKGNKWLPIGLLVALVIFLMMIWGSMGPRPVTPSGEVNATSTTPGAAAPTDATGKPQNADDFLMRNK